MSTSLHETPRKRARGQTHVDIQMVDAPRNNVETPRKRSGGGHKRNGTQGGVTSTGKNAGQTATATQAADASEGGGSLNAAIDLILMRHREYRGLQQSVGDMERRIKSETRWFAVHRVYPNGPPRDMKEFKFPTPIAADLAAVKKIRKRYFDGLTALKALQKDCLDELLIAVRVLPVQKFVEDTKGFALPSLAAIIGHAGDLSNYAGPAKLWKRFSLHVVDGVASRRVKGNAAELQQFVPIRRAEMHVIGDTLLRAGGEYAELYRERKAYEIAKLAERGIKVLPSARIPKNNEGFMSQWQVHKRALRYIEKRLLRELWRAWREANVESLPFVGVPPAVSNTSTSVDVRREARRYMTPIVLVPPAVSKRTKR